MCRNVTTVGIHKGSLYITGMTVRLPDLSLNVITLIFRRLESLVNLLMKCMLSKVLNGVRLIGKTKLNSQEVDIYGKT